MIKCNLPLRGQDPAGNGAYGAIRDGGTRLHHGIDFECIVGSEILSPIPGTVTKIGLPYANSKYRYVQVSSNRIDHRIFYVNPLVKMGDYVCLDQPIGTAQDITLRYPDRGMKVHIHYEIKMNGHWIDPNTLS